MTKVIEINKLVHTLIRLSAAKNSAMRDILLRDLNRVHVTGETSGYGAVLDFCRVLGIVKYDGNRVTITKTGIWYSKLCSYSNGAIMLDNPDARQKKALLEMMLDSNVIMMGIMGFINGLHIDFTSNPKSWVVGYAARCSVEMLDFMKDVDFVYRDGDMLRVHKDLSNMISIIKNQRKKTISEKELTCMLQAKKEVGIEAENLTMEHERKRLDEKGLCDMALAVQNISAVDVTAGYDILSFDGVGSSYEHDMVIEAKGTRGNGNVFFWSEGEIEAAKELGSAYWIYFWRNVGKKGMETLEKINDPYERFFGRAKTKPKPVKFRVEVEQGGVIR